MGDQPKSRPGFYNKHVSRLGITLIAFGILSMGLAAYILGTVVTEKCVFEHYDYGWENTDYSDDTVDQLSTTTTTTTSKTYTAKCYFELTASSPGMWSGFVYVITGIIGVLAGKKKNTCLIISMMVMAIVTAAAAANSIAFSIASCGDYTGPYDTYPLKLIISNAIIATFSAVCFVLSWVIFGLACRAVCCGCCQEMKDTNPYVPVQDQPVVFSPAFQYQGASPAMYPAVPQQQVTMQPVYMVQGNQVIGMLPPNMQQMNGVTGSTVPLSPQVPMPTEIALTGNI